MMSDLAVVVPDDLLCRYDEQNDRRRPWLLELRFQMPEPCGLEQLTHSTETERRLDNRCENRVEPDSQPREQRLDGAAVERHVIVGLIARRVIACRTAKHRCRIGSNSSLRT